MEQDNATYMYYLILLEFVRSLLILDLPIVMRGTDFIHSL